MGNTHICRKQYCAFAIMGDRMNNKLLVEVTLVPVVTAVIAEPGDNLMVLNGVCVGVSTAKQGRALPPPPSMKEVVAKPKKRNRDAKTRQRAMELRQDIIVVLNKAGKPMMQSDIRKALPARSQQYLNTLKGTSAFHGQVTRLAQEKLVRKLTTAEVELVNKDITGISEEHVGMGGRVIITPIMAAAEAA